jgi:hypothetical protein
MYGVGQCWNQPGAVCWLMSSVACNRRLPLPTRELDRRDGRVCGGLDPEINANAATSAANCRSKMMTMLQPCMQRCCRACCNYKTLSTTAMAETNSSATICKTSFLYSVDDSPATICSRCFTPSTTLLLMRVRARELQECAPKTLAKTSREAVIVIISSHRWRGLRLRWNLPHSSSAPRD